MPVTFKISSKKYLSEDKTGYSFCESKRTLKGRFSVPKSQTLSFKEIKMKEHFMQSSEDWIEITVTDWVWSKMEIDSRLRKNAFSGEVIIPGETHFGINWDYVIINRRNKSVCFLCHGKITSAIKTVDHFIPKSIIKAYGYKGGIPNNTVPCCRTCNAEKSNLHPEVYRELVKRKIHEGWDIKYRTILFTLNNCLVSKNQKQ